MADDRIIEVYRRERGQIARSVARIAGDHFAEDIVHDAFEAYLSHAPWAIRPGAWISRVARNRALNTRRGMRLVPLEGHEEPSDGDAGTLERQAVGSVVAEAMTALPDRPRTALRMRFFEGASYEDVAEALGVRVPQAHVVVHRALRMLGREMVRRMADAHGAGACAPALARMAGIGGGEEHGHGPAPCPVCRPAWDEIVALRAVNGFSPWVLGFDGVRRFLRRIFGGAANRPEIIEPAGRLATAVMAVGVAAASAFTAPAAAAAIVRPPTDVPNNAAVTSLDHAASQAAVAGAPVKAKSSKPPQGGDAVVDSAPAGGTTHSGGATHVEGRPPVGGTRLGVIVCPPDADDCIEG